jgi:hypothetical protein
MSDYDNWFTDADELGQTLDKGKDGRPQSGRQAEAVDLVNYWMGKAKGSWWPFLNGARVRAGLIERIYNPDLIYQSATSLCGVASFVRELAWDDPVQYGLFGAILFEGGWANLGHRKLKKVQPRELTRMEHAPLQSGVEMHHADWLVLASVRDAFNTDAYVNDIFEGLRGMTVGSMPEFFRAAGYDKVTYDYSATSTQGVKNMEAASDLLRNGYAVTLFVHSSLLDDSSRVLPTAQHWIVLRSPIDVNYAGGPGGVTVRVEKVWSWANEQSIPQSGGSMPLADFQGKYYGYVAAKAHV